MEKEALQEKVRSFFPEVEFEEAPQYLTAVVPAEAAHALLKSLRNDPALDFDFLFCQTALDWPDRFMVVYHLRSTVHGHEMVVKGAIPDKENPVIDTVNDIWRTAEFHEREIYDLFGIVFKGHPDLRRIFLTDDWIGYPLRKDYVDEVNIVEL